MSDRIYLAILGLVFLSALIVFSGLLFLSNPSDDGILGVSLFYLSLGLIVFLAASFSQLGLFFWKNRKIEGYLAHLNFHLNAALAFFAWSLLFLAHTRMLTLVNGGLVFLILSLFELWMRKNFKKI